MPTAPLALISSMATRKLLTELVDSHQRQHPGVAVALESVGGVDAARRVAAGEAFDAVALGSDAIDQLIADGHLLPGSRVDIVRSGVAVAVRAGAPHPDIGSEAAVQAAVLAAPTVSYSTGPSGVALARLFQRWGLADAVQAKLVVPPPGTPVGALVARGEVALGFQQLSELIHVEGIRIVGGLPAAIAIDTVFSAGVVTGSAHADAVQRLLAFMASPEAAAAKRRQGMEPA